MIRQVLKSLVAQKKAAKNNMVINKKRNKTNKKVVIEKTGKNLINISIFRIME